jgi:hypothetical protein
MMNWKETFFYSILVLCLSAVFGFLLYSIHDYYVKELETIPNVARCRCVQQR